MDDIPFDANSRPPEVLELDDTLGASGQFFELRRERFVCGQCVFRRFPPCEADQSLTRDSARDREFEIFGLGSAGDFSAEEASRARVRVRHGRRDTSTELVAENHVPTKTTAVETRRPFGLP